MVYDTIDTHEAIDLFHHLMEPDSQVRVLRLIGEAKMGKSHLLTKVFPILTRQKYQARCAVLDVRNKADTISDVLQLACSQFGPKSCDNYEAADQLWTNQPRVKMEHMFLLFSFFNTSARSSLDEDRHKGHYLTTQFLKDISKLDDKLLVFFFDSVDTSDNGLRVWLMDTLLVQLAQLVHVRVVVAGRSLPDPNGAYTALCRSYQLQPVIAEEEYITYCRGLNIADSALSEQTIQAIACVLNYSPGLFAELVPSKYAR